MTIKISITLRIWRQYSQSSEGKFQEYYLTNLSPDMSILEALDHLNQQLIIKKQRPVNFDHDCREGICGSCGFLINGQAHGPEKATTVCQLYLRHFRTEKLVILEPWRANSFQIIQDLVVDRSALDRLIISGGFCSTQIGKVEDANDNLVAQDQAYSAFQAATCIGCGACVASCRNASASLFAAAKLAHLGQLPQGQRERAERSKSMKEQMNLEGFGSCSNNLECEAVCPKEIPADWISWMNKEQ